MTDLYTLLQREFMLLPRQRGFYWRRLGVLALPCIVFLFALGIGTFGNRNSSTATGLEMFNIIGPLLIFVAWIAGALIAGNLVVKEIEEHTMQVLSLTYIDLHTLFIGKAFSALTYSLVSVGAALPLLLLSVSLGGVDPMQIVGLVLLVFSVLVIGVGTGLLVGIVSRTGVRFAGAALLVVLLHMIVVPLLVWSIGDGLHLGRGTIDAIMVCVSPYRVLTYLASGTINESLIIGIVSNVFLGVALALAGLPFLRRVSIGEPALALPTGWRNPFRRFGAGGDVDVDAEGVPLPPQRPRPKVRPPIGENPLQWRDYNIVYGGMQRSFVVLVWLAVIVACLLPFWISFDDLFKDTSQTLAIASILWSVTGIFLYLVGLAVRSALIFVRDQRSNMLESLMLTDITSQEIVAGKCRAVNLSLLPYLMPLVCQAFVVAPIMMAQDLWNPGSYSGMRGDDFVTISVWMGLYGLVVYYMYGYGIPRIAFWVSLHVRSATAVLILIIGSVGLCTVVCFGLCTPVFAIGALVGGLMVNEYLYFHMRRVILERARG